MSQQPSRITLRRKLGILYWKVHKRLHLFVFRTKRYWVNVSYFLRGLFKKTDLTPLKKYRHVIICAHPDDETIFFSTAIKEHKPFVICMSHRGNPVRSGEFHAALAHWGVDGCMCNMPDVPNHFAKAWEGRKIRRILKKIAGYCDNLERVYTHNSSGESDHRHHHGLGCAVAEVFSGYDICMTAQTLQPPAQKNNAMYTEKYTVLSTIYGSQCSWLEKGCGWFLSYMSDEKFEKPN